MPQSSQIIGANSVTNIELAKGVLPAPIVRNADWFESCLIRIADRILRPSWCQKTRGHCVRTRSLFLTFTG
jgi:hypothetical protein